VAKREGPPELSLRNRKAWHLYEIVEKLEAGIELLGTEVKSIRAHNVDFTDAYVSITKKGQEAYLENLHIGPWPQAAQFNHEPRRKRRLLLHRIQLFRLQQKIQQQGLTLVPLSIYGSKRWIKVELGLGKGKKLHDKRESLKEKQSKREVDRELKERSR
jgi:SsrA-binding protein